MVDLIPSVTEQVYELLVLIHLITISVIIPAKIIMAHTIPKVNNSPDSALGEDASTGNAEDEHNNQFRKINKVPLQKQCFIIVCCSVNTGKRMLDVATALFLTFATTVKTYEIASSTTAIIFATLKRTSNALYIIIYRHLPIYIQQCLQPEQKYFLPA